MLKTTFSSTNVKATENSKFLTLETELAFLQLKKAFTKALIFLHFDLEHHIWIETNVSEYAIGRIFCQLILESSQ